MDTNIEDFKLLSPFFHLRQQATRICYIALLLVHTLRDATCMLHSVPVRFRVFFRSYIDFYALPIYDLYYLSATAV